MTNKSLSVPKPGRAGNNPLGFMAKEGSRPTGADQGRPKLKRGAITPEELRYAVEESLGRPFEQELASFLSTCVSRNNREDANTTDGKNLLDALKFIASYLLKQPDQGIVHKDGRDIASMSTEELKQRYEMLSTKPRALQTSVHTLDTVIDAEPTLDNAGT